jgi:hypothetical protein
LKPRGSPREVRFEQSAIPHLEQSAIPHRVGASAVHALARADLAGRASAASARLKAATPVLISGGLTAPKPSTRPLTGAGVMEKRAIGDTMTPWAAAARVASVSEM